MQRNFFYFILAMFTFQSILLADKAKENENYNFNANLDGFTYPFKVQRFEFTSQKQKLSMAYMTVGESQSKKKVLLLHGKNFSGYYWEQIAKDLAGKGYFVIIPDQIGFGKSSKPQHYQYSFAQLALNTHQFMNKIGISSYDVVGHSMGGMLATHMASRFSQVKRLIMINPIGLEDYRLYAEFKDPEFFYEGELKKTVAAFRSYQQKNYYAGAWNESYETLLTPFKGWRSGPDWPLVAWNNALTYAPIFAEPISPLLADIKKDVVLIIGTRDRTAPGRAWLRPGVTRELGRYDRLGKEVLKLNPDIKLYELPGLGHMPQFEDYQSFQRVFKQVFP